jgi:hypothetical protein
MSSIHTCTCTSAEVPTCMMIRYLLARVRLNRMQLWNGNSIAKLGRPQHNNNKLNQQSTPTHTFHTQTHHSSAPQHHPTTPPPTSTQRSKHVSLSETRIRIWGPWTALGAREPLTQRWCLARQVRRQLLRHARGWMVEAVRSLPDIRSCSAHQHHSLRNLCLLLFNQTHVRVFV